MKGQVKTPKFTGEERVRSESSDWLTKLLEGTKTPKIDHKIVTDSVKAVKNEAVNEAKKDINALFSQVFGIEMSAGKEIKLGEKKNESAQAGEKPQMTREFFEYVSELEAGETKKDRKETAEIKQQIEMILIKLNELKQSSDELEGAFKDVVIDAVPEKPGKYHLTFFEGFLKVIIKLKDKVDDAAIFAKLFKSRKQERSYSSMAKKGGTSYTLHHDRAVATQTG